MLKRRNPDLRTIAFCGSNRYKSYLEKDLFYNGASTERLQIVVFRDPKELESVSPADILYIEPAVLLDIKSIGGIAFFQCIKRLLHNGAKLAIPDIPGMEYLVIKKQVQRQIEGPVRWTPVPGFHDWNDDEDYESTLECFPMELSVENNVESN